MEWPIALIAMTFIAAVAVFLTLVATGGMRMETEKRRAERAEELQRLVERYETLAAQTRDSQASLSAEMSVVRDKVDAMEQLMRTVD